MKLRNWKEEEEREMRDKSVSHLLVVNGYLGIKVGLEDSGMQTSY